MSKKRFNERSKRFLFGQQPVYIHLYVEAIERCEEKNNTVTLKEVKSGEKSSECHEKGRQTRETR
jgi:hypothetical protein